MQDARTRLALLIVCLACLLGSGFVLLAGRHAAPPPIMISSPPPEVATAAPPVTHPPGTVPPGTPPAVPKLPTRLYVDVAGAVRRPSLYALPPGSRVMQAILVAGGPTGEADTDSVNLAEPLTDGEKVFVPRRGVPLPVPTAGDVLPSSTSPAHTGAKPTKGTQAGRGGKVMADSGEQVALNTATEADLERLPGVGPSMAGRILAYRQSAGRFEKVEDLMQVSPQLSVEETGEQPMKVTLSAKEAERFISFGQAIKITA